MIDSETSNETASLREEHQRTMPPDDAGYFADSVANYLFGHEHNPVKVKKFTAELIEKTGDDLLENDHAIRELVVQSLRIKVILSTDSEHIAGRHILEKYGKNYKTPSDPSSYFALINRTIASMPPSVQKTYNRNVGAE